MLKNKIAFKRIANCIFHCMHFEWDCEFMFEYVGTIRRFKNVWILYV